MEADRLAGGNVTGATRDGDTVLRGAGPWTPTVHRLLAHLRRRGFDAAPLALGTSADGREVLQFLPGTVPVYPLPDWVWRAGLLDETARMLRRWHDASTGFDRDGERWQTAVHEPVEVICHNDFAPHNLVFDDGRLTGVIDVDLASPGPRIWDVAYLATRIVPLSSDHPPWTTPAGARARLDRLIAAYDHGLSAAAVLDVAHVRLLDLAAFCDARADAFDRPDMRDFAAYYRDEAAWLGGLDLARPAV